MRLGSHHRINLKNKNTLKLKNTDKEKIFLLFNKSMVKTLANIQWTWYTNLIENLKVWVNVTLKKWLESFGQIMKILEWRFIFIFKQVLITEIWCWIQFTIRITTDYVFNEVLKTHMWCYILSLTVLPRQWRLQNRHLLCDQDILFLWYMCKLVLTQVLT